MNGAIVDVYREGCNSFRACVLEVIGGSDELATVVNLESGNIVEVHQWEVSEPIIENIFEFGKGE